MTKVLLISRDEQIKELVGSVLPDDMFYLKNTVSIDNALEILKKNSDITGLVIIDLYMDPPGGLWVLSAVRRISSFVPCVVVGKNIGCQERTKAYGLGADDCIELPIKASLLSARIKVVLRRCNSLGYTPIYNYGGLCIDEVSRKVSVDNTPIDLTPKEYELLFYLAANKNIALSRKQIFSAVWGYDKIIDERTVDNHIKNLRAKLSSKRDLIQTCSGYGYRFEVPKVVSS